MNLRSVIMTVSLISTLSLTGHAETKKATQPKKSSAAASSQKAESKKQSRSVSSSSPAQTQSASVSARKPMVNSSLSEYAFQPAPGHHAMSARTYFLTRNHSYRVKKDEIDSKDDETAKGFVLMARYDRGLQNGWGVAAEIGTTVTPLETSRRGENDGRAKGFTDITLTGRNHRTIQAGELTYGGQATLSPNSREMPTNRDDGNMQTGGHSLAGFVGLQKETQRFVVGGQFKHTLFLDRSASVKNSNNQTTNITISNGNTLDLEGYMEMPYDAQLFGASAGLTHTLPTDYSYKNSSGGKKFDFASDSYNILKVAAYGNMRMASMKNLEILPQISYHKVMGDSGGTMSVSENSSETVVSIGARFSL